MTPSRASASRARPSEAAPASRWFGLAGWIGLTAVAGATGAFASRNAAAFYGALDKASWAPPAWLFGPVWSVLYLMMAVAAWLVWRERGWSGARVALGLFVTQLLFNGLWTWCFFVWHDGGLAFAEIIVLVVLIVATILTFARVSRLAAMLLVPYLAWVLFATALTISVWLRNPTLL
jgi:tryptophan-rich sensory protein